MTRLTLSQKVYIADYAISNNIVDINLALQDFKTNRRRPTLIRIASAVCGHYRVSFDDLRGKSRNADHVKARHVFLYIARTHGYKHGISGSFVGRDHATTIHAYNKIKMAISDRSDPWFDEYLFSDIEILFASISGNVKTEVNN